MTDIPRPCLSALSLEGQKLSGQLGALPPSAGYLNRPHKPLHEALVLLLGKVTFSQLNREQLTEKLFGAEGASGLQGTVTRSLTGSGMLHLSLRSCYIGTSMC